MTFKKERQQLACMLAQEVALNYETEAPNKVAQLYDSIQTFSDCIDAAGKWVL